MTVKKLFLSVGFDNVLKALRNTHRNDRSIENVAAYKVLNQIKDTTMFIAILTYKKPLEEVDRFLQAHRNYLAEHYATGDFIASGPQNPRIGGVIMITADNRASVDTIISQDPFNINGIADYQIVEFTPTMFCEPSLSDILK